ncbi:RDD family protein [Kitasatospora sp. NPDC051853]|uniref:RDD family protein n=1 Tax=Kitasatospora sp. NPDC051853 TaxID=3364058 RepID=UPI0037B42796
MTERPFATHLGEPGTLAAAAPAPLPGYYPDPSVPGFVRYWGGASWVPGTSRPAPVAGEHLEPPRGVAQRPANLAAAAPPPPVVPFPSPVASSSAGFGDAFAVGAVPARADETGPVYFDETTGGASFVMAPFPAEAVAPKAPAPAPAPAPMAAGWQAAQARPAERISWGAPVQAVPATVVEPVPVPAPAPAPVDPEPESEAAAPEAEVEEVVPPKAVPAVPEARRKPVTSTPVPAPAAARRRSPAAARKPAAPVPAGLGRRLTARLVDSLVLVLVAVAAGVPMGRSVSVHLSEKLDDAHRASEANSGVQVQVWLVDGTVLGRAGVLLGLVLLAGLLYEVLPVARTGQTFGKRLAGIKVVDADRPGASPSFGRSVLRWVVRQAALLSVFGMLAPVRDRKGRRAWQDRAAGTRVVRSGS